MKTVVIFESVYGSTRQVAEELAAVARRHGQVDVVRAEDADVGTLDGADLVLVGGPTHLHGLSTRASRQSGLVGPVIDAGAGAQPGPTSPGRGCETGPGPWGGSRGAAAASTPGSRGRTGDRRLRGESPGGSTTSGSRRWPRPEVSSSHATTNSWRARRRVPVSGVSRCSSRSWPTWWAEATAPGRSVGRVHRRAGGRVRTATGQGRTTIEDVVERWHRHLRGDLPGGLDGLLDDDVIFYSPIILTPQVGRTVTTSTSRRRPWPSPAKAPPTVGRMRPARAAISATRGSRPATRRSWSSRPPSTGGTSTGRTSSGVRRRSDRGVPGHGPAAAGRRACTGRWPDAGVHVRRGLRPGRGRGARDHPGGPVQTRGVMFYGNGGHSWIAIVAVWPSWPCGCSRANAVAMWPGRSPGPGREFTSSGPAPVAGAPVTQPTPGFTGTASGWFVDPFVRHEQRYWSGTAWTEHVLDGGTPSLDPPPPPRTDGRRPDGGPSGHQDVHAVDDQPEADDARLPT